MEKYSFICRIVFYHFSILTNILLGEIQGSRCVTLTFLLTTCLFPGIRKNGSEQSPKLMRGHGDLR
jgi:hypothetical protein